MADERQRVRMERSAKRVRAYLGGVAIADSTEPWLVWEKPFYPTYYFPQEHVRTDLLVQSSTTERVPSRGDIRYFIVKNGDSEVLDAAYHHPESPVEELRDLYAFRWDAMDSWFEEDVEVHTHARDPYTRIDTLPSSRHVVIEVDGVKVADSNHPTLLFETGLPVRYYLPKTDVRFDLLAPTDRHTRCPYKGTASYWTLAVNGVEHPNVVWSYPYPLPESMGVAGMVCFYNEKVDMEIDGVPQERPRSPFS